MSDSVFICCSSCSSGDPFHVFVLVDATETLPL